MFGVQPRFVLASPERSIPHKPVRRLGEKLRLVVACLAATERTVAEPDVAYLAAFEYLED